MLVRPSRMNKNLVLSTLTFAFLGSCGDAARTPLTGDQKRVIVGVLSDSSTAMDASQNVAETRKRRDDLIGTPDFRPVLPPDQIRNLSSLFNQTEALSSSIEDRPVRLMEDAMAECEATFPEAPDFVETSESASISTSFSLGGEACPVSSDLEFHAGIVQRFSSFTYEFAFDVGFDIVDPEFEQYTELRSLDLEFGMKADIVFDEDTQEVSATGEFAGGGHVETTEVGRVPLTVSGGFSFEDGQSNQAMVLIMEFTDFVAEFELIQEYGKEPVILLNGEPFDEDYFSNITTLD